MVCSLHVSTKTGPTAILRCFMQPYSLTDLLLKKQRFLDTSVERLWNRTQTEDITLFPEGLTRIICGITWGRGKHGVNSDGTSCQSCHCQTEILRQSNDTQQLPSTASRSHSTRTLPTQGATLFDIVSQSSPEHVT